MNPLKRIVIFRLETAEQEAMSARTDLRLAVKRIEDLQTAMSGEIASDSDRSDRYHDIKSLKSFSFSALFSRKLEFKLSKIHCIETI